MQKFCVGKGVNGKRIDNVLFEQYPGTPAGVFYKAFKRRDVKVNGIRVEMNHRVSSGDTVEVYAPDDQLAREPDKGFETVYEDKNLLVAEKRQGIAVHGYAGQNSYTLINTVKKYLASKSPDGAEPWLELCHRLDRNTGGLVVFAKNPEAHEFIVEMMETKAILKFYTCLVFGRPDPSEATLRAWLEKDSRIGKVFVSDEPGGDEPLEIVTKYRTLAYDAEHDISKLEVELRTGRTHQIRAHLAHIGNPVVGDGKYGSNAQNRPIGAKMQALWASRLEFRFDRKSGALGYLTGKILESTPDFAGLKFKV